MKIVILVSGFPPRWLAGTEIATYNIAAHLAKRGHDIHIITTLDKGLPKESKEKGFYVHRIAVPRARFLWLLVFWPRSLALIRRINPQLVHAQSLSVSISSFLAKKLYGIPYLVWARGDDVYLQPNFSTPLFKLSMRDADSLIALTNHMRDYIQQKICDRDIIIVPNGIDFERFKNLSKDEVRCDLKANADDRLVICVSGFRPVKGVRYLIEAMQIITQKNRSIKLLLAGDGPEEESLKELVRQLNLDACVDFLGQLPYNDVPRYMAASDLFVLPSLSEGFPNVGLEAMASGLPVVATNVRGLSEIIEDGENGFLVEPEKPDQIAEKVLSLLEDDGLRHKISGNNREKAKSYSWARVAERVEEIYQSHLMVH
ncbi:MAG: glycosyltransferase family 4 protein [Planctomycetes bacterium]|nr:glycosyltransferase family 4 protein [Planctomycetota bacterium]